MPRFRGHRRANPLGGEKEYPRCRRRECRMRRSSKATDGPDLVRSGTCAGGPGSRVRAVVRRRSGPGSRSSGRDAGERSDGLRTEERDELRRLRSGRTGACAKSERYCAKATAWFAREARPVEILPVHERESGSFPRRHDGPSVRQSPRAGTTRGVVVLRRLGHGPMPISARVQAIHGRSRGAYGAPRIHAELTEGGVAVSRKRVARVMRSVHVAGVKPALSRPSHEHAGMPRRRPFAPDRVEQALRGGRAEPALGRPTSPTSRPWP